MRFSRFLASMLVFAVAGGSLTAQAAPDSDRLVNLETHLEKIRAEYASSRLWGSGLLVGSGVLVGVAGVSLANQLATDSTNRSAATNASLAFGGVLVGSGVIVYLLKSDYEKGPEAFEKKEDGTPEAAHQKVLFGETTLQSLADSARFYRFLGAGTYGVLGAAILISGYSPQTTTSSTSSSGVETRNNPQAAMYSGLAYLGLGVLQALLETTPEREHRAYLDWLKRS